MEPVDQLTGTRLEEEIKLVLRTLQDVVDEFGHDYVYPDRESWSAACFYVRDGKPSCLAGQVVHRLGVPLEKLKQFEAQAITAMVDHVPPIQLYEPLVVLRQAQVVQDRGGTWGQALETAKKFAYNQHGVTL